MQTSQDASIDKWITTITICICFHNSILQIPYVESMRLSIPANLTAEAATLRMDISDVTDGHDEVVADPSMEQMELDDMSLLLPAVALPTHSKKGMQKQSSCIIYDI